MPKIPKTNIYIGPTYYPGHSGKVTKSNSNNQGGSKSKKELIKQLK